MTEFSAPTALDRDVYTFCAPRLSDAGEGVAVDGIEGKLTELHRRTGAKTATTEALLPSGAGTPSPGPPWSTAESWSICRR